MAGTRGQIAAFTRCVQARVSLLRHAVRLAAIASVFAACFTDPPAADTSDDTTGGSCTIGEQGCACYGNGTCEAGLECSADVQLCIPEQCMPGDLACICADGGCVPPYVCAGSLCMPMASASETSDGSADTSGSTPSTGTEVTSASSGTDSSSDGAVDTTSDPTGGVECAAESCPDCVSCVDTHACAAEVAACDVVNGCMTAVDCLIQCGVYLDCLDPCCADLTTEQLAVVNDLILCKSDECVATCEGEAEIDGCR